jgi:NADPH:quinone reductase-like Zn-dependent oxidoreductase
MKAVAYRKYGPPRDVLELRDVALPVVPDGGVLVRVRAVSINPFDWYFVTGRPYFIRAIAGLPKPKREIPGADFAGVVESVGKGVTHARPGDEVFGVASGALAECACASENELAPKPARLSFEQAASMPVAALTALQGLRDWGAIRPGDRVLINGASGGVGTFAVQIAKALGATVTGVCSTKHVDIVRSIGADDVVDYTRDDFTRSGRRYDLILDVAGSRSWSEYKRVLGPDSRFVLAGGPRTNPWIGPLGRFAQLQLGSIGDRRRPTLFVAKMSRPDLLVLAELIEAGKLTPVIHRRYELGQVAEAFDYIGEGHASGKVVVAL